jgi:hypothetical protein
MASTAPGSERPDLLARMEWAPPVASRRGAGYFLKTRAGGAEATDGSDFASFFLATEGATRWIRSRTM